MHSITFFAFVLFLLILLGSPIGPLVLPHSPTDNGVMRLADMQLARHSLLVAVFVLFVFGPA